MLDLRIVGQFRTRNDVIDYFRYGAVALCCELRRAVYSPPRRWALVVYDIVYHALNGEYNTLIVQNTNRWVLSWDRKVFSETWDWNEVHWGGCSIWQVHNGENHESQFNAGNGEKIIRRRSQIYNRSSPHGRLGFSPADSAVQSSSAIPWRLTSKYTVCQKSTSFYDPTHCNTQKRDATYKLGYNTQRGKQLLPTCELQWHCSVYDFLFIYTSRST